MAALLRSQGGQGVPTVAIRETLAIMALLFGGAVLLGLALSWWTEPIPIPTIDLPVDPYAEQISDFRQAITRYEHGIQ